MRKVVYVLVGLCILSLSTMTFAQDLNKGLVGLWTFEDDTQLGKDYGPFGNDGKAAGVAQVEGIVGEGAAYFDGTSDSSWVRIENTVAGNPELNLTTDVSVSWWFQTEMELGGYISIIRHEHHFTPFQFHPGGAWVATFTGPGDPSGSLNLSTYDWDKSDGGWHHAVVTFDGGASQEDTSIVTVYIDMTQVMSDSVIGLLNPNESAAGNWPWMFGRAEGNGERYTGALDQVRFYDRVLTEEDVVALYDEESTPIAPPPAINLSQNLAAYYTFDDADNVGKDYSSYENDGYEDNVTQVQGIVGTGMAAYFDGAAEISIPNTVDTDPELNMTSNASASAWFLTAQQTGATISIVRHESHFTPMQISGSGAFRAVSFTNASLDWPPVNMFDWTYNDSTWHHYACTFDCPSEADSAVMETWFDGVCVSSGKLQEAGYLVADSDNNWPWMLGRTESASEPYIGALDEVRLYNKTLTDAEILRLYAEPSNPIETGVENPAPSKTPVDYALSQNYPNPFNPVTNIEYVLPKAGFVSLKVYNMMGQEVATLVSEKQVAAKHTVSFDASALSSGVYFYKLSSGSLQITKKMVLVR